MGSDLPGHIIDQAVEWAVKMGSGTAGQADRKKLASWRRADPRHEAAWLRLTRIDKDLGKIPGRFAGLAVQTLADAPDHHKRLKDRRNLIRLMGLGIIGIGLGYLSWPLARQKPGPVIVHQTPKGNSRILSLSDESRVRLNTASEIRVDFSGTTRRISLDQGEIYIETGRDANAAAGPRPFWVDTTHARVRAVGTRFNVRQTGDETRIHVMDGKVHIHPRNADNFCEATAGQTWVADAVRCTLTPAGAEIMDPVAWVDGVLVARNMALDTFARELTRYHNGTISCDPGARDLKISGVFQLQGPGAAARALSVLTKTLPVSVSGRDTRLVIQKK